MVADSYGGDIYSRWSRGTAAMLQVQEYLMSVPTFFAVSARAVLKQQREILSFMATSCEQQLQLVEQFKRAGTLATVFEEALEYGRSTAENYAGGADVIIDMASGSADDAGNDLAGRDVSENTEAIDKPAYDHVES